MIYLDTHVVIWMYIGDLSLFSRKSKKLIDAEELKISPMVILELHYMEEAGRLKVPAGAVVKDLQQRVGLSVCDQPFPLIIEATSHCAWTRDPFDRIIVGQAQLSRSRLLTKDKTIRRHYSLAMW